MNTERSMLCEPLCVHFDASYFAQKTYKEPYMSNCNTILYYVKYLETALFARSNSIYYCAIAWLSESIALFSRLPFVDVSVEVIVSGE